MNETDVDIRATAASSAAFLLDEALALDIPAWTTKVTKAQAAYSITGDGNSRLHIASAHRAAACLYILQALPAVRSLRPLSCDQLVAQIVSNLEFVDEHNPHFKATAWPSFVAGAEIRDHKTRDWLLRRLLSAWEVCPWGYIFTAVDMLKKLWEMADAGGLQRNGEGEGMTGLRGLWNMKTDVIVV